MKVLKFSAVLLLAVGMFSTAAIATGPEDDCVGAIAAPTLLDPCTDLTPTGPLGSCTSGGGVLDQWATFVAPATSTRVRTDIGSAGSDSDFIVYSGTCGSLTEVGCAEDIGVGNYLSDTCVGGLTVGATYYVQMGSWADGCPNGPYNLTFAAAGTCGNGTVECGEQCDDGNTLGGDCCSATCQNETICGNGCVEFPEACDDGNVTSGDGCSATCELEQFCGDNLVNQPSEECDGLGAPLCAPGLHCTPSCKCVGGGVPAVSEWGLAVLTLIGLVSGTILFGRRRVAVR